MGQGESFQGSEGKGVTKESPVGREAQGGYISNVYIVEGHLLISP